VKESTVPWTKTHGLFPRIHDSNYIRIINDKRYGTITNLGRSEILIIYLSKTLPLTYES